MVKRLRGAALQKYNAKRRREAEAAEAAAPVVQDNEPDADDLVYQPAPAVVQAAPPVQQAAPPVVQAAPPVQEAAPVPKTEVEITTEILTELAEKQEKYIQEAENLLTIWNGRYKRLAYYESFLENIVKRKANLTKLAGRLKDLKAEIAGLDRKEGLLLESINSMKEQIKRLEKVYEECGKYHGQEIDIEQKEHGIQMIVPDQTSIDSDINSFPTLNDLLVNTGASARIRTPAPLLQNDLNEIKWPEEINYEKYSAHLAKNTELAIGCRHRRSEILLLDMKFKKSTAYRFLQLNKEEIKLLNRCPIIREVRVKSYQDLIKTKYAKWKTLVVQKHIKRSTVAAFEEEEKRLSALQESRDAQFEKIRKQVNQEEYKCEICLQLMTSGDSSVRCPKIFGSCGHTACAECMIQFEDSVVDQKWKCPECRTESTQTFTNWTVMKKISPEWQHKRIQIE